MCRVLLVAPLLIAVVWSTPMDLRPVQGYLAHGVVESQVYSPKIETELWNDRFVYNFCQRFREELRVTKMKEEDKSGLAIGLSKEELKLIEPYLVFLDKHLTLRAFIDGYNGYTLSQVNSTLTLGRVHREHHMALDRGSKSHPSEVGRFRLSPDKDKLEEDDYWEDFLTEGTEFKRLRQEQQFQPL
ncbi:hypothetical protein V498_08709 [Pseudogymnoascus sp. VKM F-4517 (FW-2822)]|nr:hypothetical protein V498_08709 [Pseudogymnoascus sp. VKM F-4517 (FW-2822)]